MEVEMKVFFALILQMGHEQRTTLKSYWSTDELYYTSKRMSQNRFFHIIRFLHFADNTYPPDKEVNYDL
jgi:hypothetical protein